MLPIHLRELVGTQVAAPSVIEGGNQKDGKGNGVSRRVVDIYSP